MSPTIMHLRLDDPERAASNPALAKLLGEGWTVAASFVGERSGVAELVLLLSPPAAAQRSGRMFLATAVATATGAAVGAFLALLAASTI